MKSIIWMCDIISSSKMPGKALMREFESLVAELNSGYADKILSPITITLGDEFQAVIKSQKDAIELILAWEEKSIEKGYKFKVRHVLWEGEIDTAINSRRAFKMLGSGLTDARNALNAMKMSNKRFCVKLDKKAAHKRIDNAFVIYQEIIDNWSLERDYPIAAAYFKKNDYKVVAELLGRERSLIWKREKTMRMDSYFAVKEILTS